MNPDRKTHIFDDAYAAWSERLKKINLILIIATIAVDWIGFAMSRIEGTGKVPWPLYILLHIALPFTVNMIGLLICHIREKNPSITQEERYALPLFELWLIGTTVAISKYLFPVLTIMVCVPIFCSVYFDNRNLTRKLTVAAFASAAAAGVLGTFFRKLHGEPIIQPAQHLFMNLVMVMGMWILSYALMYLQRQKNEKTEELLHMENKLQDELKHDSKTGLYSAAVFHNALSEKIREGKTFYLMISDIDDFCAVNNNYGHNQGDIVLVRLAEILRNHFSDDECPSRFGGEEFTALIDGSRAKQIFQKCDAYRKDFEEQTYSFMTHGVTISVGLAMWEKGITDTQLFDRADRAMYFSKRNGKNMTTLWEPQTEETVSK